MITAVRSHTLCAAHRLVGYPGACANIHGHAYRFEIEVGSHTGLNGSGMVMDFADIKALFCSWLDNNWDHRLILWTEDPLLEGSGKTWLETASPGSLWESPFNPTAENMAVYLLEDVFPAILKNNDLDKAVFVSSITVFETEKCAAKAVRKA